MISLGSNMWHSWCLWVIQVAYQRDYWIYRFGAQRRDLYWQYTDSIIMDHNPSCLFYLKNKSNNKQTLILLLTPFCHQVYPPSPFTPESGLKSPEPGCHKANEASHSTKCKNTFPWLHCLNSQQHVTVQRTPTSKSTAPGLIAWH